MMDPNRIHRFGKSGYRNNYMPQIARQSMEGRLHPQGMSTSSNSSWTFSNSQDIPKPRKGRICGIFLIGAALVVALSVMAIGGLAFYIGGYSMDKHHVSEYKTKENPGAKRQFSTTEPLRKAGPKEPESPSRTTEPETKMTESNQTRRIPEGTLLGITKTMQQLNDGVQGKTYEEDEEEVTEATTEMVEPPTELPPSTEDYSPSVVVTKDVEILPKKSLKSAEEVEDSVLGFDLYGMQNGHARPAYAMEERVLTAHTASNIPLNLFPPKRDYSDEPWKPIIPSYREPIRVRYPPPGGTSEEVFEPGYKELAISSADNGDIPITFSKDSFDKNLRVTHEYVVNTNGDFGNGKQQRPATSEQISSIASEIADKFKDLVRSSSATGVQDAAPSPMASTTDITIIGDESRRTTARTAATVESPPRPTKEAATNKPETTTETTFPIGVDQFMSSVSMVESSFKPGGDGGIPEAKTTPGATTVKTVWKMAEIGKPVKEAVVNTKLRLDSSNSSTSETSEEAVTTTESQVSSTSKPLVNFSKSSVTETSTATTSTSSTSSTTTSTATTKATTSSPVAVVSTEAPLSVKETSTRSNLTIVNPFLDDSRSSSSNFNFGLPDFPIIKQFHHLDSLFKSFSKPSSAEDDAKIRKFLPRSEFGNDTSITRFPARTKQTTVRSYSSEDSVFVQVSTVTPEKATRRMTTPPVAATRRPIVVRGDVQVVSGPVRQFSGPPTTETPKLITLLPVRSNVNMMRPLRPRPKSNVNGTFVVTSRRNAKMNSGFKTNDQGANRTMANRRHFEQDKNGRLWVHYPSYKPAEVQAKGEKVHIVTPEPAVDRPDVDSAGSGKIFNFTGNLTNVPLYNTIESLLNSDHRNREGNSKDVDNGASPLAENDQKSSKKNTSEIVEKIVKIMENIAISTGDSPEAIVKVNQTLVTKTTTSPVAVVSGGTSNETDAALPVKVFSSHYKLNQAGVPVLTKVLNRAPNVEESSRSESTTANATAATTARQAEDATSSAVRATTAPVVRTTTTAGCNSTDCATASCLTSAKRCNQFVDCPDAADEKNCTCADHLKAQQLHRKLCDGIVDCWDFTDEYNCEWCKDEFLCSNSKMCIKKTQICDGSNDCPFGDDERNCVTISPSRSDAETFNYHSNGYLMVRKNGRWGKLCIDNFDSVSLKSKTGWKISDLGRSVCKALTFRDFDKVERMISVPNEGRSIGNIEKYYELAYNDMSNGSHSPRESALTFHETECSKKEVVKVTCTDLECGLRPQATTQWPRIVGGGNASPGSWPWQAALYREGEFQCGGTLISENWLISAGHCFFHHQNSYWVARLGTLRTTLFLPSPYEQLRHITEIFVHPQYVNNGFINDISLLRIRDPVKLTDYVRPICLPKPQTSIIDGAICTIVGWGQLSEVGLVFPDTLQEVQLPILSTSECRKRTLFLSLYKITDDMFCAGYDRGGRDACLGDSGGPLMCTEPDGKWTLYGITSNGYGCARSNRPGVYTKVSKYLDWINAQMTAHSEPSVPSKRLPEGNAALKLLTKSVTDVKLNLDSMRNLSSTCEGHRCPLGECLPKSKLCDGHIQCSDGSDEKDCW